MTQRCSVRHLALFAGLFLSLTGCTNTRDDQSILTLAQSLSASMAGADQTTIPDPETINAAVQQALMATDRPLALLTIERTGTVALITPIERNGAYQTWASLGTSERRSITTRSGLVTATRGLGGDLMSSHVTDVLSALRDRREGEARQVLRHLNGENIITETVAQCSMTARQDLTYARGALNRRVTPIDLVCESSTGPFSNRVLLTSDGRVVEARQWLGPVLGMSVIQQLR